MYYIFEVTARPGYTIDQYAKAWVAASELIQQTCGAKGTRLCRKIGDNRSALAIAEWENKLARDDSTNQISGEARGIISSQIDFVDIRFIGEYEAPDWTVLPPS